MASPNTVEEMVHLVQKSNLLEPAKLEAFLTMNSDGFESPAALCKKLRADGLLTPFHAQQLLAGKHKGFFLGKYKILDRIGLGGMGQVFLAEHGAMKRRAALKVLPPDRTERHYSRERFLREARAAGQLDHPNLVRAFDFEEDGDVIFLVMEFVDGVTFHDLVLRAAPLAPNRVANYLLQCANGLGYLHSYSLVHRDIKPANLLVDRQGIVKILDLGLVRSEVDEDNLTKGEGVKILGTADYLPPEQAIDCSKVDVRADIYGLGATAYYLFTGRPPFVGDHVAQKLIAHQIKTAKPIHEVRPDVPVELSAIITKMLAKKPADRFQTPAELAEALKPFTLTPPALPTEDEIPMIVGGAFGNPGSVNLSGSSSTRTGGSSLIAAGSSTNSAIRYYADGKSVDGTASADLLNAITPRPRPTPLSAKTPIPVKPPVPAATPAKNTFQIPTLPAIASHGVTPKPLRTSDKPIIDIPELFKRAAALPSTSTVKPSSAEKSKQWIVMGLAFSLVFGIVVWATFALIAAPAQPALANPSTANARP